MAYHLQIDEDPDPIHKIERKKHEFNLLKANSPADGLNEVGNVHRHLVNLCVVELLDVLEVPLVVVSHEVDRHALPTEATAASNPVKRVPTHVILPNKQRTQHGISKL